MTRSDVRKARAIFGQLAEEDDVQDDMQDNMQDKDGAARTLAAAASRLFAIAEMIVYLALGTLLVLVTSLGIAGAAGSLWRALLAHGSPASIVGTIDQLLFVFMLVEILHTVRVSFRSGTLLCEPFLIVGLIASIRRILVITLKSSQNGGEVQGAINATMLELLVLGGLIFIMVASIVLLRRQRAEDGS